MHTTPDHSAGNPGSQKTTCLLIWALGLLLLLFQTLGLVHSISHGSGSAPTTATGYAALWQSPIQNSLPAAEQGALSFLFPSHSSSADCRLYDQASHGSAALQVICLVPPVVLPSAAVISFQGGALARWAALFDARGPPLTF